MKRAGDITPHAANQLREQADAENPSTKGGSEGRHRDIVNTEKRATMKFHKTLTGIAAALLGLTILVTPVFAATNHFQQCPDEANTTDVAKPVKFKKL